jgi:hypothetical protein
LRVNAFERGLFRAIRWRILCTHVRGSATPIGNISYDVTKALLLSSFSLLEIALEDVTVPGEVFQVAELELALA